MGVCMICQGGQLYLFGGGGLATRGVATRLLGGFGGMLPPKKFLNGAIWYVLEHIFINFFTFKKSKNIIFIQK